MAAIGGICRGGGKHNFPIVMSPLIILCVGIINEDRIYGTKLVYQLYNKQFDDNAFSSETEGEPQNQKYTNKTDKQ